MLRTLAGAPKMLGILAWGSRIARYRSRGFKSVGILAGALELLGVLTGAPKIQGILAMGSRILRNPNKGLQQCKES